MIKAHSSTAAHVFHMYRQDTAGNTRVDFVWVAKCRLQRETTITKKGD